MANQKITNPGGTRPDAGTGRASGESMRSRGPACIPGRGLYPGGEADVRTPGEFVHGQVDEEGRPVEGGSEITMTAAGAGVGGGTPTSSSPPQGQKNNKDLRK